MKWHIVTQTENYNREINGEVEKINRIPDKVAVSLEIDGKLFCVEDNRGLFIKDDKGWQKIYNGKGSIDIYRKERLSSNGSRIIVHYGIGFKGDKHLQVSKEGQWLNKHEFANA